MAESEEELKRLLIKKKEESEKVGLKLIIQKTKIVVSDPKGIRLICRELDIEPFTTYNIRHTFAAYSVEYNIPAEQLMMLLGHKNITTTQVYLKSITNNLMEKTTDFISEMLNSHQKKAL